MGELDEMLDPEQYFRINSTYFVAVRSIDKIDDYFGNRLITGLKPVIRKGDVPASLHNTSAQ